MLLFWNFMYQFILFHSCHNNRIDLQFIIVTVCRSSNICCNQALLQAAQVMLILFGWYNALCCGPSCSTIHGSLKGCKYLKALFFFSQIYKSWGNEIAFQGTCLHGSFLVLVLFMSPTFVRSFTRMVEFPILFSG